MALHGVLAHVVFEQFRHLVALVERDGLEPHLRTDKVGKLGRRDFAKSFEAGDFGVGTKLFYGGEAFLFAVTVNRFKLRAFRLLRLFQNGRAGGVGLDGAGRGIGGGSGFLLLIAHAEERRLQDVHVAFLDEVGEELQEEGDHQQAYVHAVHVGIGRHDDLVVAQSVQPVLDVERGLQEVELLIFIDNLFRQSEAVERLSAQREHGLRAHVAAFGDRAAGRVALGDKDGGVEARVALVVFLFPTLAPGLGRRVVEVNAAVAQLTVVQVGLLGTLAGQFRNAGNGLALRFAFLYLLADHFCHVEVLVEEVVHVFFDKVAHKLIHAHAREGEGIAVAVLVGSHGERAEFDFRLALKHRLYHAHGNRRHEAVAHVLHVEVLVEIFLDGAGNVLLERALVRAALRGVLPVYERVVFLAILRRVGEGNVYALAFEVHDGVKPGGGHIVGEQVFEAVAADDAAAVVIDGKSRVEVGVVAEHRLHKLAAEAEVAEEFRVRLEIDVRAVFLLRVCVHVAHEHAALKGGFVHLAVAVGAGDELAAQGVHGFQAHAVQTHAGGEYGSVVFRAGVEFRHGVHEAAQGNAAPVVAD